MYFPYFRGRQYELLALRELTKGQLLGKSIIPIIEPVQLTSTLDSSIKAFNTTRLPVALILNPTVGGLAKDQCPIKPLYKYFGKTSHTIPSLLFNQNTANALSELPANGLLKDDTLAVLHSRDSLEVYKALFSGVSPRYTLCPDERQIRRTVNQNKVLFENKFRKQDRNADYPDDEFFSDDHLFFASDNYVGFGDYSIIGDEYTEGGFAPYAVAIHIVYFADDNTLRIRHFLSNSNEDISDVAGKFHEAVSKLVAWYHGGHQKQQTSALSTLLNHYETGYYPGLPTIKKLSIMHHLELMGRYLDGGLQQ